MPLLTTTTSIRSIACGKGQVAPSKFVGPERETLGAFSFHTRQSAYTLSARLERDAHVAPVSVSPEKHRRAVEQPGSSSRSYRGGRRFKSCRRNHSNTTPRTRGVVSGSSAARGFIASAPRQPIHSRCTAPSENARDAINLPLAGIRNNKGRAREDSARPNNIRSLP